MATVLVDGIGTDGTVIGAGAVGLVVSERADGTYSSGQFESRVLTEREVAETYLDYIESDRHVDQWASTVVTDLSLGIVVDDDSLRSLLVLLVALAPSDRCLSRIGAGPLEDMLNRADERWLATIESEARRSQHLREALASVWGDGPTFERIRALL